MQLDAHIKLPSVGRAAASANRIEAILIGVVRLESGVDYRCAKNGALAVCTSLFKELGWLAPLITDEELERALGRTPQTRIPGERSVKQFNMLLQLLRDSMRRQRLLLRQERTGQALQKLTHKLMHNQGFVRVPVCHWPARRAIRATVLKPA